MSTKSEQLLEAFKVFSENYAKPFLSNPKVTTALILVILVRLGFDVAGMLGLDKSVEEDPTPIPVVSSGPAPIVRTPEPTIIKQENKFDPAPFYTRLEAMQKQLSVTNTQVGKNTDKLRELDQLHQ